MPVLFLAFFFLVYLSELFAYEELATLHSQLFLTRSIVSLNRGIPGLFYSPSPHEVLTLTLDLDYCIQDLLPFSIHQGPLLTQVPLKQQAGNFAKLTISHIWTGMRKNPWASLSADLRMLRIPWPSKPCWLPSWAAPQVVTNLFSWVSRSEGAGTPHLQWRPWG